MFELEQVTNFAQYGVAGLALYYMYRLFGNHLNHNTDAILKLVVAVTKLSDWLEDKYGDDKVQVRRDAPKPVDSGSDLKN